MGRPPLRDAAMSGAERMRRLRRLDRLRDQSRGALSGDLPDERSRKLEASEKSWSRWIDGKVKGGSKVDTIVFLASALARAQQIAADDATARIRELIRQL
jgi:hypothetical protein